MRGGRVVADSSDVQQTPVGLEADWPPLRQIVQPLTDGEVARMVGGGFSARDADFFVVLLDPRPFTIAHSDAANLNPE